MKRISYIIIFFTISISFGFGQNPIDSLVNQSQDSILINISDSTNLNQNDSLFLAISDSLKNDSIAQSTISKYNISKDAIEGDIDWGAKDLQIFDRDSNKLKLYNEAYVNYGTISLKAGYNEFDLNKNEISGVGILDSLNKLSQNPQFKDKKDEFIAKKIRYNIKSKKGWVDFATKKEGELTIHGEAGKFISAEGDTINHVDNMFIQNGVITNCSNVDHPHWGIKANKIKLIPNKLAVFGFSNLEVAEVPMYPLVFPFGMYPIFQGQHSGLILPKKIDRNRDLGVGVRDVGVYFIINDYVDIRLTADYFTRGSHGVNLRTNFNKRYKYNGNFTFTYFNTVKEITTDTSLFKVKSPRFSFGLTLNQDSKAHPFQKFGGRINFSLNGFDRAVNSDYQSQQNNTIRSNFHYTNSLPSTPFSLSVGLDHSQNNKTHKLDLTLPSINLNMNTIYPFKLKNRIGKEKWFEKISLSYKGAAKNVINATDTTIFNSEVLDDMKYGIKQNVGTNATFRVLKYINTTVGVNYEEKHHFKTIRKHFDKTILYDSIGIDDDNNIVYDTTFGSVITDTLSNYKVFRHISPRISFSTNRYGKILFKKGLIRGIKHKVSYNISISGNPFDEFLYYADSVDTDTRDEYNKKQIYSFFEYNSGFGESRPQRKNLIASYSIRNLFEAKYFSKTDSSLKKLSLLKNLSITGNYNITADSFNFSTVRVGFNFSLFKNFISIKYNGTLDPYLKANGRRIDKMVWTKNKFIPLRHERSEVNISVYNKSFDQIYKLFVKEDKKSKKRKKKAKIDNEKLFSILKNFRLNYNVRLNFRNNINNVDTFFVSTHSIRISGTLPISNKWKIRVNNLDYNLKEKRFAYPDIGFERDLHCWKMNFSWQPKGGTYSFFIGVRSSVLQFVKYNHGVDPLRSGFN